MNKGIIIRAVSGFYYVKIDDRLYECRARGKFRNDEITPLVGDVAEITDVQERENKATLNKILPRKNCLYRPPIANVDRIVIVVTPKKPAPNLLFIDKILAIAEQKNIESIICINKMDLFDSENLKSAYENCGYTVLETSATSGEGIDKLLGILKDKVNILTGSSGVGKSSLINVINKNHIMETGEISKINRGKHTTRHTELFMLEDGGYIADSPGFSSLELQDINASELAGCFREFKEHIGTCRFPDCSHTKEKECMIVKGVENGSIQKFRHENYIELYNKLKSQNTWDK